jgi:hypothetical protein
VHRFVPVVGLLILLCGCGGGGTASPPTPVPLKTYADSRLNLHFKYPGSWSVPKNGGHQQASSTGAPTYIVPVNVPGNAASVEVTADGQIIQFPAFANGHIAPDPSGGPDYFHYYHTTVDGRPAMRVERWAGKQIDEIDTFVNTSKLSFDIRTDTGAPPYPKSVTDGYATIVRTIKLPF